MRIKNKKILLFFLVIFLVFLARNSFADVQVPQPIKGDIPEIVGRLIKYLLGMVGVLALVMFIYGGITWMTSGGNPEKIKKGRDTLVWAVAGLAFIFFSYALLKFILEALTK